MKRGLRTSEIEAVAPNVVGRMYLLRPTPAFATPHLCTLAELRTVYTIDDLADMHEILDLRQATIDRAAKEAEAERERQRRQRGRRR